MRKLIVSISFFAFTIFTQAQLKNPGFESIENNLATDWKYKAESPFDVKTDNAVKHSGVNSLQISSTSAKAENVQTFSQKVPISGKGLRKVEVSVYIKSENIAGDILFWTQVRKDEKTMLDFANTFMQDKVNINTDWKKYTLNFILDDDAQYFVLGGLVKGSGNAWFDDVEIKEVPFSEKPSSKVALKYIDDFKKIVKKNSIFNDKIDWATLDNNLKKISTNMETVNDTDPSIQYILKTLRKAGDHHSFIDSKERTELKKTSNPTAKEPEYKLLDGNIGYIMVPSFSSINDEVGNAFGEEIQKMIKDLDTQNKIKGWIVDLRSNSGGNMYPMIGGLGPLIGNGTLGYFTDGKKKKSWEYNNGKTYTTVINNPYTIKNPNQKIAVLIGPNTASSGEATAISFIGKSNVKTFGQPSGGYTSANQTFSLSDGKTLQLSTSFEMDRNGKEYLDKIIPDQVVEPSKEANTDSEILAASKWLLE